MKEEEYGRRTLRLHGAPAEACYVLLCGKTGFGIAVELRRDGLPPEREAVADVTVSRTEAELILEKLFRGTVTPCTLRELLPELLE